ncbi:crotonobetainyl-CoA:carnitine CoA-transferase CaiB-like acyl-CoA transferase [Bradyrhizobium sp. JR3.5]
MSQAPTREKPSAPAGPLAGVRIIDLTSVMIGPYATMILGDYGADVIKVESPDGDVMRHAAPMRHPAMGAMYLQGNRNKRSIVLDLKKAGGRAALLRLATDADVFVHNVRPAAMARLKLGADDLLAANPRLVYASLHGFGETGPYAGRPAYDDLIQGLTALPALTGRITGEPRYSPATMADRIVGLNAVHAILAALFHRERTGEGQAIEIPMFETMAQFVLGDHMAGRSFAPPIGPSGYSRLLSPDRRPYQTSDGYICALVYSDKQWNAFFAKIGLTNEADRDPRLNSISARTRNYDFVYDWFSQMMKTRSTAEWMRFFEEARRSACAAARPRQPDRRSASGGRRADPITGASDRRHAAVGRPCCHLEQDAAIDPDLSAEPRRAWPGDPPRGWTCGCGDCGPPQGGRADRPRLTISCATPGSSRRRAGAACPASCRPSWRPRTDCWQTQRSPAPTTQPPGRSA